MDALRLFVVRHGGTAWTAERRFTGARDVLLSPDGRLRAEAVARALGAAHVAAVYASPLDRARATAAYVAKRHGVDVRPEPAFRDMKFGAWEGLTPRDVASRFPGDWATWRDAPQTLTRHGGEPLEEVAARAASGLAQLQREHAGQTVVLVTHAVVARLIVLGALGLEPERLWSVDASPGGITELDYAKDWVSLHRMNTMTHLEAADASATSDADAAAHALFAGGAVPGGEPGLAAARGEPGELA